MMNRFERDALGAFRHSLERAIEHSTTGYIRLMLSTEQAKTLLATLTPDDADVEESERDELWATLHRLACNLCDCDQMEGEDASVDPRSHRDACRYSLAYSAEPESMAPLVFDENSNFALG